MLETNIIKIAFPKYVLMKVVSYHYAYCSTQIYKLTRYHNNMQIFQTPQKVPTGTGIPRFQVDFGIKECFKKAE